MPRGIVVQQYLPIEYSLSGHKKCVLIQYQHDAAYPEKGIVEIVSLDTKKSYTDYNLLPALKCSQSSMM